MSVKGLLSYFKVAMAPARLLKAYLKDGKLNLVRHYLNTELCDTIQGRALIKFWVTAASVMSSEGTGDSNARIRFSSVLSATSIIVAGILAGLDLVMAAVVSKISRAV